MLSAAVERRRLPHQSGVLGQAQRKGVCSVVVVVVVVPLVASVQVKVVVFEMAIFEVNVLVGKETLGDFGCCASLFPVQLLHGWFQNLALVPWTGPLPLVVLGVRSNDENPGTASWQESP